MSTYQRTKHQPEAAKQVKANKPEHAASQKMNPQQILAAPETLRPEDVLAAQQQLGNQVVQRALDDKEQPRAALTDKQGNLRDDISSSIQQSRGSGSSLPKDLQSEIGHKLGHDFSNVRLHTDEKADKLSQAIHARAFTIGSDVYFKGGVYAPSTREGRETLIHELTHVVQQSRSGTSGGKLKLGAPNTAMEKEADKKGKQGSQSTLSASAGAVQRVEDEEEIQTQPEDEEEIQMQSEEEEIQMQEDEEEVQMQAEEEEEVQMQPDAGGVVQRFSFSSITDLFKKKDPMTNPPPMPKPSTAPIKPRGKPLTEKGQAVVDKLKSTQPTGSLQDELQSKRKAMGLSPLSSKKEKQTKKEAFFSLEQEQAHRFKRDTSSGVDSKSMVQVSEREKLVHTLKNPNSTPEQMKEAEDKLRSFHKSGKFKKNPASIALKERKKALMEAARGGDAKAQELYKKENPGFLTKAGNFFGKVGDMYTKHKDKIDTVTGVLGKVGGFLGIGGGKKDEEKAPGGGGGDGGGYAVIISQLMQENKMLKEKLAGK